jgi:hypothetical protein
MTNSDLDRLRVVDWSGKPEATICSQLITPVLFQLGYGEHTLHKVLEQRTYTLKDPYISKGSRRVRLDYQPRVYEVGLWVMEAKGTDVKVTKKTLGQVRDYAIHPEVRAALMVTVDAAGFRVFDPWDAHWDTPLLTVGLDEVADRIEDLRAVLGVDRAPDYIRRRHIGHLKSALSASLEFGVLQDAEEEFRGMLSDVRATIASKRNVLEQQAWRDAEELRGSVLKNSGVWGVAQEHNSPWPAPRRQMDDFAKAVLAKDEAQRPTQILAVRPAIEAVYRVLRPEITSAWRPVWWLHVITLAGCIQLRGKPGCEPFATDSARQGIRDCVLGFPDGATAAASWRFQRVVIPMAARVAALAPIEQASAETRARLSPENRIRYPLEPSWFFMRAVRMATIRALAAVDPWTPENLDAQTKEASASLTKLPIPPREWPGLSGDPWLASWETTDVLREFSLHVLLADHRADDLIDEEGRRVIAKSASVNGTLLARAAVPLASRLGLAPDPR